MIPVQSGLADFLLIGEKSTLLSKAFQMFTPKIEIFFQKIFSDERALVKMNQVILHMLYCSTTLTYLSLSQAVSYLKNFFVNNMQRTTKQEYGRNKLDFYASASLYFVGVRSFGMLCTDVHGRPVQRLSQLHFRSRRS